MTSVAAAVPIDVTAATTRRAPAEPVHVRAAGSPARSRDSARTTGRSSGTIAAITATDPAVEKSPIEGKSAARAFGRSGAEHPVRDSNPCCRRERPVS